MGPSCAPLPSDQSLIAVAVDERSNRVFVATWDPMDGSGRPIGRGSVSVLDARSGSLLRTIPVGKKPRAIAVDEQRGRALVANGEETVPVGNGWEWVPDWLWR